MMKINQRDLNLTINLFYSHFKIEYRFQQLTMIEGKKKHHLFQ